MITQVGRLSRRKLDSVLNQILNASDKKNVYLAATIIHDHNSKSKLIFLQ